MKVTIGIPNNGYMHSDFVKSLISLVKPASVISLMDRVVVHYARNIIANKFIDGPKDDWGEYLLWIDSDQVFAPDSLIKLLKVMEKRDEIDILGALVFKRTYPHLPTMYEVNKFEKNKYTSITNWKRDSIVECDAIGHGFTLVRRRVYTKLSKPFYKFENELGEDLYFCREAKKAGFKIACHTGVVVGHLSDQIISFEHFRRSVELELVKKGIVIPKVNAKKTK